eukprot:TRINITY_DN488_c0_g2_i1.p1 TRINITY_DN488_c0_g2~~TRINITY_DN488_c0_g2_i1.p1  ORF type:complete len:525 (+),score=89.57 TRINITY_DN488_c0_g2_i1:1567-3141(+)
MSALSTANGQMQTSQNDEMEESVISKTSSLDETKDVPSNGKRPALVNETQDAAVSSGSDDAQPSSKKSKGAAAVNLPSGVMYAVQNLNKAVPQAGSDHFEAFQRDVLFGDYENSGSDRSHLDCSGAKSFALWSTLTMTAVAQGLNAQRLMIVQATMADLIRELVLDMNRDASPKVTFGDVFPIVLRHVTYRMFGSVNRPLSEAIVDDAMLDDVLAWLENRATAKIVKGDVLERMGVTSPAAQQVHGANTSPPSAGQAPSRASRTPSATGGHGEAGVCYKYNEGSGCRFGSDCRFVHACGTCGGEHPAVECPEAGTADDGKKKRIIAAPSGRGPPGGTCYKYNEEGHCRFGADCKYVHACGTCGGDHPATECTETPAGGHRSMSSGRGGRGGFRGGAGAGGKRGACYQYNDEGHCRFGASCKFTHICSKCGGEHSAVDCHGASERYGNAAYNGGGGGYDNGYGAAGYGNHGGYGNGAGYGGQQGYPAGVGGGYPPNGGGNGFGPGYGNPGYGNQGYAHGGPQYGY